MKYLIISLLKSKLLHQHLFTFSQKVTFSLNVNIKFDETTQNPVRFAQRDPSLFKKESDTPVFHFCVEK